MSMHWIFGGKKGDQSVYISEKKADNAAGDYTEAKQHIASVRNSEPAKKPVVYAPSSYVIPGFSSGQFYSEKDTVEPPAPVNVPLEVKPEVIEPETPKTDDEVDAQIIDPHSFFEEFRRKQSELEQMVERFCSVTAIKSESLVSCQRSHVQPPQIVQQMVPSTTAQISNAKPPTTEPRVDFQHTPSVGHQIPSVVSQPTNFSAAKKRLSEASQYLGELSDVHFAIDQPTYNNTWMPTKSWTNGEDATTTSASHPAWNAPTKPRGKRNDQPSEYHFLHSGH